MQQHVRGHTTRATTPLLTVTNTAAHQDASMTLQHQALEQCLLDAQRQMHRLEEVVHRLTSAATRNSAPSVGAISLMQESNRRLQRELDEFTLDSLTVLTMIQAPAHSPALRLTRT